MIQVDLALDFIQEEDQLEEVELRAPEGDHGFDRESPSQLSQQVLVNGEGFQDRLMGGGAKDSEALRFSFFVHDLDSKTLVPIIVEDVARLLHDTLHLLSFELYFDNNVFLPH